jgi:uncharacterized oligopeptide transporter (OPT) family protein
MDFNPVLLTFGAIAGAFMGIGFIIPLRKQMIDHERLTYPGGVAVATILKSPGAGIQLEKIMLSLKVYRFTRPDLKLTTCFGKT